MSNHTPGPWQIYTKRGYSENVRTITGTDHGILAEVYSYDEANARLIAAAPELAEALQAILVMPWTQYPNTRYLSKQEQVAIGLARAALAKAGL